MSAYAMFNDNPFPIAKTCFPKPSFSPSSTVVPVIAHAVLANTKHTNVREAVSSVHHHGNTESSVSPRAQKICVISNVFGSDEKKEPNNDLVGIAVTSANVDYKRYIAATSRSRSRANVFLSNNKSARFERRESDSTTAHDSSSWEEAVEFEISITLNGRTYTRKRSFPRIVRLRNELVKEVRNRRRNHPGRFGVLRSFVFDPGSPSRDDSSSSERRGTPRSRGEQEGEASVDDHDDSVTTTNLCDVEGLSLTNMQSKLNGSYCPAIETWLQSVSSELVDPQTSPTLADFLKEDNTLPAGASASRKAKRQHLKRRHQPSNQLWSISEDEPCTEKDDDVACEHRRRAEQEHVIDTSDPFSSEVESDEDNECDAYFNAI